MTGMSIEVKTRVQVSFSVDAASPAVDSGIRVRRGDKINLIAQQGSYKISATGKNFTYEGDAARPQPGEGHAFPNAASASLVGWVGTATDKTAYFQVRPGESTTMNKDGYLYFAVNDHRKESAYYDNRGGLYIAIEFSRRFTTDLGIYCNIKDVFRRNCIFPDGFLKVNKGEKLRFYSMPVSKIAARIDENPSFLINDYRNKDITMQASGQLYFGLIEMSDTRLSQLNLSFKLYRQEQVFKI